RTCSFLSRSAAPTERRICSRFTTTQSNGCLPRRKADPMALMMGILFPAFLAGMLVLATHVPLGQQVLSRGIVFIDLAIAQVAGLGVTAADAFGFEPQGWRVQAAALAAALLGAFLLTWTEKLWPEVQEALIGVLFVLSASVELLVLANNPRGGEHLKDLLV